MSIVKLEHPIYQAGLPKSFDQSNEFTEQQCKLSNDVYYDLITAAYEGNYDTKLCDKHRFLIKETNFLDDLPSRVNDLNLRDKEGCTALDEAINKNASLLASKWIQMGINLDRVDSRGWTPLYRAAHENNVALVHELLERGADSSIRDNFQWTALYRAIVDNNLEAATALLEHRADANVCDENKLSALHRVIHRENALEVINLLVAHDFDMQCVDYRGRTLLHAAASKEFSPVRKYNPELLSELLKHIDVNTCDKDKQTALHYAVLHSNKEVLGFLLDHQANINARDKSGFTPLAWACIQGYTDLVEFLLDKGADANLADYKGQTPLDHVKRSRRSDLIDILKNAGGL